MNRHGINFYLRLFPRGLTGALVLAALLQCPAPADQHVLKGRILDEHGHPVAKARVILKSEDDDTTLTATTDGRGSFRIHYPQCSFFNFEVQPPAKTSLASAAFDHVSGQAGKHFIVRLHRGFSVTGRVVTRKNGLKGLTVRVMDRAGKDVHGGGTARTGADGEFTLMLTPGAKTLEIVNDRYLELAGSASFPCVVTADTALGDLELPSLR